MSDITSEQWRHFQDEGYAVLNFRPSPSQLRRMQDEIDAIMLGTTSIDLDRIMMQLDSTTGKREDVGRNTQGSQGSTLNYRKIQNLEYVPVFLEYLKSPIFRNICARIYGTETSIAVFRSMFMNKPANRGTPLGWHQDCWTYLDRDPILTIWTALDPATDENGCLKIIPRSHLCGVINPANSAGFLTPELADEHCPPEKALRLELEPGEVVMLHNKLLHSSEVNRSSTSRRAFSVCYMDAKTKDTRGLNCATVFGTGALSPADLAPSRSH